MRLAALVLLLAACDLSPEAALANQRIVSASEVSTMTPRSMSIFDSNWCAEFDHKTTHNGTAMVCRMLWCNKDRGGGPATLWCDPVTK